jgi:UDP-glucose:(heptosyl)LPS alpha-1,3-glucosyltransferase
VGRRLRLAIIRQRYNPYGGAERFLGRAMAALAARGVEITLFARRWEPVEGMRTVRVDPFYAGSVWRDAGFARQVCAAVSGEPFDLVQSHERLACCDVYRAGDGVHREWLAQRARAATAAERLGLGLNPYHRYTCHAEARLFASPRLKAVICNSRMVRDEIVRHFGADPARLEVIYNGVDTAAFSPALAAAHRAPVREKLGIPQDAPVFLFVGSGFVRKGLETALAALRSVEGWLVVVGGDKRAARFEQRARELGVAPRVRFVGPQRDVKPYYGAADAFVLPTLYDPFPNAVLEALACGLPVVTSFKCGAAEIVSEARCGLVGDALDVRACAAYLGALLDRDERRRMGQAARTVAETLDLDRMSTAMLGLYDRLLAQS